MTAGQRMTRRQRTMHARRRRRLLLWSAPVVVLVVVLGLYLTGLWAVNAWAVSRYDEEPASAAGGFEGLQQWSGPVEPWKYRFNAGTAQVADGRAFAGSEELREALRLVPEARQLADAEAGQKEPTSPECRVRRNLSLALEALGDETDETGDSDMAASYWAEAQEIITPCTSDEENEEAAQRQQDKQDDAQGGQQPPDEPDDPDEQPTPEPSDEPDDPDDQPTPEPTPSDEPTSDAQKDELEERNRDAQRERQQQQERGGGGYGGGQNW